MRLILLSLILLGSFQSKSPNWTFDIDQAKVVASEESKHILISFSGSDWCKPCIKLSGEVFETNKFIEFTDSNFVLVKADFPRSRKNNNMSKEQLKHNDKLAEKYNPKGGFPLVVITDANGNVVGQTGYIKGGPDAFINKLNKIIAAKN